MTNQIGDHKKDEAADLFSGGICIVVFFLSFFWFAFVWFCCVGLFWAFTTSPRSDWNLPFETPHFSVFGSECKTLFIVGWRYLETLLFFTGVETDTVSIWALAALCFDCISSCGALVEFFLTNNHV